MKRLLTFILIVLPATTAVTKDFGKNSPIKRLNGSIQYNSDFKIDIWGKSTVALLPIFDRKMSIDVNRINEEISRTFSKVPSSEFFSGNKMTQLIRKKKLVSSLLNLRNEFSSLGSYDYSQIPALLKELNVNYLIIPESVSDNTFSQPDQNGFTAKIKFTLFKADNTEPLVIIDAVGNSINYHGTFEGSGEGTSLLGSVVETIKSDLEPSYELAYFRVIQNGYNTLMQSFTGEPLYGDCLNGIGVLSFYDDKKMISDFDKIACTWKEGFPSGAGILYEKIKIEGINAYSKTVTKWKNGKRTGAKSVYLYTASGWKEYRDSDKESVVRGIIKCAKPSAETIDKELKDFMKNGD